MWIAYMYIYCFKIFQRYYFKLISEEFIRWLHREVERATRSISLTFSSTAAACRFRYIADPLLYVLSFDAFATTCPVFKCESNS
jgi:hypothetical protein